MIINKKKKQKQEKKVSSITLTLPTAKKVSMNVLNAGPKQRLVGESGFEGIWRWGVERNLSHDPQVLQQIMWDDGVRPEAKCAIILYILGSCAEYRVVANQFGVHKSTVNKFVYKFCKAMVSLVIHNFIKVPMTEESA